MLNGGNRDVVNIKGSVTTAFSVSSASARSAPLDPGIYDIWSNVAINILVNAYRINGLIIAQPNVTVNNGYLIPANKVVSVYIESGDIISAVSSSTGTISLTKTGEVSTVNRTEFVYSAPSSDTIPDTITVNGITYYLLTGYDQQPLTGYDNEYLYGPMLAA